VPQPTNLAPRQPTPPIGHILAPTTRESPYGTHRRPRYRPPNIGGRRHHTPTLHGGAGDPTYDWRRTATLARRAGRGRAVTPWGARLPTQQLPWHAHEPPAEQHTWHERCSAAAVPSTHALERRHTNRTQKYTQHRGPWRPRSGSTATAAASPACARVFCACACCRSRARSFVLPNRARRHPPATMHIAPVASSRAGRAS
jgi:hypothetical protein